MDHEFVGYKLLVVSGAARGWEVFVEDSIGSELTLSMIPPGLAVGDEVILRGWGSN